MKESKDIDKRLEMAEKEYLKSRNNAERSAPVKERDDKDERQR